MKRVLNICPYKFLPYTTGGEKYIGLFNEHLAKKTILHVAGVTENDTAAAKGYQVHTILGSSRYRYINFLLLFKLRKLIVKEGIHTVILEHPYLGWMGMLLKLFTHVNMIVHTHNVEYQRFRSLGKWWWWILKYYETAVLRCADMVFCISNEDRRLFQHKMKIKSGKTAVVPFGINTDHPPIDKKVCKEQISQLYGFEKDAMLLLFTGSLDYKPNIDALHSIVKEINPRLISSGIKYNILIAGKGLPKEFNQLKKYNSDHVWYAGFVEDIDTVVKAADLSLNPVQTGGGVKTKVIESISLNTAVVSTKVGATGIDQEICGDQLISVEDNDWDAFTAAILKKTSAGQTTTPSGFYSYYSWTQIEEKIALLV